MDEGHIEAYERANILGAGGRVGTPHYDYGAVDTIHIIL